MAAAKVLPIDQKGRKEAEAKAAEIKRRIAAVDRLGEIEAALAPLAARVAPLTKEAKALRDDMECWPAGDGIAATQGATYEGLRYDAFVSACGRKQHVLDKAKAYAAMGKALVIEHWTVTLEKLKAHLSADQYGEVVEERQDGPRKVTTAPKVTPIATAAEKVA